MGRNKDNYRHMHPCDNCKKNPHISGSIFCKKCQDTLIKKNLAICGLNETQYKTGIRMNRYDKQKNL